MDKLTTTPSLGQQIGQMVMVGFRGMNADEAAPFLPVRRVEEHPEGLGAPLDDLLQNGDALEEVLVQGDLFLLGRRLVVRLDAPGDDEELALTLPAELPVELVQCAADLADQGSFSPPGPA